MSGLQRQAEGNVAAHSSTTDLKFFNLSARWGHGIPQWPSAPGINLLTLQFHALDGVYVTEFEGIMHRATHMDAPLHVTENTPSLTGYPLWRFFGNGVAVSIPKGKWGVITPDDLEKATPKIRKNDIVMINTGTHHKLADSDEYYAYSPRGVAGGKTGEDGRRRCAGAGPVPRRTAMSFDASNAVLISATGYLLTFFWGLVGGVLYLFYRPTDHPRLRDIRGEIAALEHTVAEEEVALEIADEEKR